MWRGEYRQPENFTGKFLEVVWSLVLMGAGFVAADGLVRVVKIGWRWLVR